MLSPAPALVSVMLSGEAILASASTPVNKNFNLLRLRRDWQPWKRRGHPHPHHRGRMGMLPFTQHGRRNKETPSNVLPIGLADVLRDIVRSL
jgi:hypothetical protein